MNPFLLNSLSFDPSTQIEYYGAKAPKNCPSEWLALPFWVYQVFAPAPGSRTLNLFEKAMLGLLQAGCFQNETLRDYLQLDIDLIRLVRADLTRKVLITDGQQLTPKGERLLREADWLVDPDPSTFITGYVFQSPFDGSFLPRFIRKREPVAVHRSEDRDWPGIDLGTVGARRIEWPFFVKGGSYLPPGPPGPEGIFTIVQQHTLAIIHPNSLTDKTALPEELPPSMQQVQIIGEAEPVWVVSHAYFPSAGYSRASWRIRDPFGLGDSQSLKTLVEKQAQQLDTLRDKLDRLFESEAQFLYRKANEQERQIREEARMEVEREFGGMCEDERLLDRIGEFVYVFHRAMRIDQDKGYQVWKEAQIVLETLLNKMKDESYKQTLDRQRQKQRQGLYLDSRYIQFLYQNLGGHEVPERLSAVRGRQAAGWIKYGNGSLRPMTIATLWIAHQKEGHPLRSMIAELPDLFNWIERISVSRDNVSHGGEEDATPLITPEETQKKVYAIIKSYLSHNQR